MMQKQQRNSERFSTSAGERPESTRKSPPTSLLILLLVLGIVAAAILARCREDPQHEEEVLSRTPYSQSLVQSDPKAIPEYAGTDVILLNDGVPLFSEADMSGFSGEFYSPLDDLGRCGMACARLSRSLMPSEPRGEIGHIRPSGWHTVKYPEQIEDLYLFNRCHLIAYALSGQNDNALNLITGTRHFNVNGMLPFEIEVIDYLEDRGGEVLYRVTPYFCEDELVARGVELEALSAEDEGAGLSLHVFIYNIQPGIDIDYRSGESRAVKE